MDFLKINNLLEPVLEQLRVSAVSADEKELLKGRFWDAGEDIRLREDWRFRQTPWGKWTTAASYLANDEIFSALRDQAPEPIDLPEALQDLQKARGYHCVFCPADPRMVMQNDLVRLAAAELSDEPLVEDNPGDLAKFTTHLPVHTLRAVAASEPIGEWGPRAQEQHIETLGWVKVEGRTLNERMFVAHIEGHSMDNAKRGIEAGKYAIFELCPAGSRTGKILLIRGSFNDPETGFYVLKQYFPGLRDENSGRRTIRLESINLDKTIYPDIIFTSEDDRSLTVVAEFLDVLDRYDYAREPKRLTRRGCRDLNSISARKEIFETLQESLTKKFAGELQQADPAMTDNSQLSTKTWSSELICLDAESGGLHLEISPLTGLPAFVKTLALKFSNGQKNLLASNLKAHGGRIPVPPSVAEYSWSAKDFEGDLAEDLKNIDIPGVAPDRPALFRCDAEGVGRLQISNELSARESYRVLLPPAINYHEISVFNPAVIADNWRLIEISTTADLEPEKLAALDIIGLSTGGARLTAVWIEPIPGKYIRMASGEVVPSFDIADRPVIRIEGVETLSEGDLAVFLASEKDTAVKQLEPGDLWFVCLDDLQPGPHVVEVTHRKKNIAPVRLYFMVGRTPAALPRNNIVLQNEATEIALTECLRLPETNLQKWAGCETGDFLLGPPCWPCRVEWRTDRFIWAEEFSLDRHGRADLAEIQQKVALLARKCPLGDCIIDANEFGRLVYQHKFYLDEHERLEQLVNLAKIHYPDMENLRNNIEKMFALLIKPFFAAFGFITRELPAATAEKMPENLRGLIIEKPGRENGKIVRVPVGLFCLDRQWQVGNDEGLKQIMASLEQFCDNAAGQRLFFSDGQKWRWAKAGNDETLPPALEPDWVSLSEQDYKMFNYLMKAG